MDRTIKIALILGLITFLIGLIPFLFVNINLVGLIGIVGLLCFSTTVIYLFWFIDRYSPTNYRLALESIFLLVIAPAWLLYQGFEVLLAVVALCMTAALCHLLVADYTLELQRFHLVISFTWAGIGAVLSTFQNFLIGSWGGATFFIFLAILILGYLKTESGIQMSEKISETIKSSEFIEKIIRNENLAILILGIVGSFFALVVLLKIDFFLLDWLVISARMFVYILLRNWQNCILFFLIPMALLFEPSNEKTEIITNNSYYRKALAVVFGFFFVGMFAIFSIYLAQYNSSPFETWWGVVPNKAGKAALKAWQALLCVGVSFAYPFLTQSSKSSLGRILFFVICCALNIAQFFWFLPYIDTLA